VTLSYLTAFALSFVLNRAFNFRSHEALAPQTTKYVVAIGINYAAFVLGIWGLRHPQPRRGEHANSATILSARRLAIEATVSL
jgi:hypothetical protein